MAAPRLHVNEILEEIMRIFEVDLKTTLSLKAVIRGPIGELPSSGIDDMVNGIFINMDTSTLIEPVQIPTDLMITYQIRITYLKRINVNENILDQKMTDVQTITDKVFDKLQLPDLTLTNGQVLWWIPTEIEWEPPEDTKLDSIAADVVAVAFRTECKVRTRR